MFLHEEVLGWPEQNSQTRWFYFNVPTVLVEHEAPSTLFGYLHVEFHQPNLKRIETHALTDMSCHRPCHY